ncbi:TauD/TfdA dioxygenase family protein [Frankia tisae]|uniref:TauD/TfdA dioxygenase family protein n=1 Tax=Frankia tisae TaxID=2950104 RepID=UPI0021C14844|nr:TauD/TfdA family dioxygenase [Frankia tisae]
MSPAPRASAASARPRASSATVPGVDIRPLTPAIGAEIRGVDLHGPLSPDQVDTIRQAMYRHHVVFFPDAVVDATEQVAFARHFGEPTEAHCVYPPLDDEHPEVFSGAAAYARYKPSRDVRPTRWHTDLSYLERPPAVTVLNLVTLPPLGGDTFFASAAAAYDALSAPLRRFVDDLVAIHDGDTVGAMTTYLHDNGPGHWEGREIVGFDPVEHPVVRVHPETGRRALFVSPAETVRVKDLSWSESDAVLNFLFRHITRPEHTVRYRWPRAGGLCIWDNTGVLHGIATDFGSAPRSSLRVMLRGPRPVGPGAAGKEVAGKEAAGKEAAGQSVAGREVPSV